MKTTIQEQDGNMVAFLAGSLDTAAVPETEQALAPLKTVREKTLFSIAPTCNTFPPVACVSFWAF